MSQLWCARILKQVGEKRGGGSPPNISSPRGEQLPPCNKQWCWKTKLLSLLEVQNGREQGKGWDKKPAGVGEQITTSSINNQPVSAALVSLSWFIFFLVLI